MRGGQWQVLRLIDGLAAAGVDATLLARPGAPLFEAARARGMRVEAWGPAALWRHARTHDLTHVHDSRSHTLALLAPGGPLVVARRVAFPIRSRWKYARAAACVAVSAHVRAVLIAGGVPEDRIAVIHDGVPLLPPAHGDLVLAVDNASDPQKGAALATAAADLAAVPLTMTSELERDLARARLFVYLSHNEGLGSAALLAMSAAVPVIASDVGGLREAIQHGENGWLVDNAVEPIAAAMRQLSTDRGLAAKLGERARETVAARFTTGQMVAATLELYRRILSSTARRG